jgi:peroxiredoxin family protein
MKGNMTGLAGEYYVLAQLTHRNLVAALTLANAKRVDILVTNQALNKLYKVEVKTMDNPLAHEKLFGKSKFYMWVMDKKHEGISEPNLCYCFVALQGPTSRPKFFVVPSKVVSKYVKWQHAYWLSTRGKAVQDTSMRKFRIPIEDPKGYEDNWKAFER